MPAAQVRKRKGPAYPGAPKMTKRRREAAAAEIAAGTLLLSDLPVWPPKQPGVTGEDERPLEDDVVAAASILRGVAPMQVG